MYNIADIFLFYYEIIITTLCSMIPHMKALARLTLRPLIATNTGAYYFAGKLSNSSVKTVNLPFLADSINEGTIAEFVKSN